MVEVVGTSDASRGVEGDNSTNGPGISEHHQPRVAGIVSGAQGVRPAFVLDRREGGAPIALLGKAWCRADATGAAIRPGDLLATSSTPGHARRADDDPAPGTVIGKALTPLTAGRGWVHVFVCRA